ncbi:MAG TPA: Ig-like domain-containing protein [Candidatus Borkfalkia avistercoris]|uniref:Ig-like domain-containing protein n=1 Tax=Candidatus Borkfalkia avistercoris TaxID=2838504 RepID=A0A9D2CY22_9FIRM|nr:Ig-like domain-containing protein [Candidatus Borkfalkia avistercoris]
MNSKKLTFTILAAASILLLCVFCAFFSKGQKTAYAAAEGANITQSGVDFINAAPEETTVYKAGEGSVTYIPAQTDGTAEIVLENAEIHSGTKVNYLPPHWAYAAVAATGDVKLILKGDNRVYLRSQSNNNPLLFYDSNVVVSGDGTLTIDRENASDKNRNVIPFHVRSDNDLSGNEEEYAKSGNFVLESGTISLNAGSASGEGCLMVINNVKILGGKIQTYGQAYGIYSVNGDVEISGGNVRAEEFRWGGVYAKRGDIKVGGDAKLYVSSYKNSSTSGIQAVNKDAKGGNVFFYGGETEVLVPNIGVYAQGEQADVVVTGGEVEAYAEGSGDMLSIGIYADRNVDIQGGSVISGAVNEDGNGSAFGVSTEGSIFVGGGALSAYGSTGAVDCIAAPVCAEKIKIFAASDTEGKNESDYNEDSFGAYKYLKFARTEVLSVTVLPSSATVEKGKTLQFSAQLQGNGDFDTSVAWKISGATSANTKIDQNGLLTVGADETAEHITVTATSAWDPEKSASVSVAVASAAGGASQDNGGGLKGWEIAAISIGAVLAAVAIAVGVYFAVKKAKGTKE